MYCMKIVHCKCMYLSMIQEQGSSIAKQHDLMHVWGTLYRRHRWKTWESTGMALLRNLYKLDTASYTPVLDNVCATTYRLGPGHKPLQSRTCTLILQDSELNKTRA